ncbi:MAG: DoxX family protein [Patescibacteria group bacterium]
MNKVHSLMNKCLNKNLGLLIIRLVVGVVFIYAGYMKFSSVEQTAGFFSAIGLNTSWVYVIALAELVGGILMVLGLFTRIAGLWLTGVMIGAIYLVTWNMGFAASQLPMLLLFTSLGLAMTGAGKWSLDSHMPWGKCDNCENCAGVCLSHEMQ